MIKYVLIVLVLISCFFIKIPGVISKQLISTLKEDRMEIIDIVKNSIEDTRWMRVSTRQEIDMILSSYYTEPLLTKLINSTCNFISKPTDWDYVIKAENIEILDMSESNATVYVYIVEFDTLTCVKFSSKAKYSLIKTDTGWRINNFLIGDV